MDLNELWSMGGFGAYVWPAYCLTFGIFIMHSLFAMFEKRRVKKIIKHYFLNQKHEPKT